MNDLTIRLATRADLATILNFIQALAKFEKLEHEVVATENELDKSLFGSRAYAEVLIAEHHREPVGFALFFHSYSTFLAKPGIYLEDLFVLPEHRSQGIGKALLGRLAKLAVTRGCGRLEWSVLNWNEKAIKFYRNLGALPMEEWTVHRVTGNNLEHLASLT